MKNIKKIIIAAMITIAMVFGMGDSVANAKETYLQVKSTVKENKVTLEWNNVGAAYYKVFKLNKKNKYVELAKIKGKRKYVDQKVKKKKRYAYKIVGYKKKKGKYKAFCEVEEDVVTDYCGIDFIREDRCCCAKNTPSYIRLDFDGAEGIEPSSYTVYRRKCGTKKWTKIKTIKASKMKYYYTDKTVKAGQKYEYRVKNSWKQKGKKTKSIYSGSEYRYAVNDFDHISLQMETLTPPNTETDTLTFKISSDKGNGVFYFDRSLDWKEVNTKLSLDDAQNGVQANADDTSKYESIEYSYDGTNWKRFVNVEESERLFEDAKGNGVLLNPGEYIYFRFNMKKNTKLHYYPNDMEKLNLEFDVRYCDYLYTLYADPVNNKAVVEDDYH